MATYLVNNEQTTTGGLHTVLPETVEQKGRVGAVIHLVDGGLGGGVANFKY